MPAHIYACHKELIAAGELERMSGVFEFYRDRHGNIALTNKNHILFQYGDQKITPEQKAFIRNGNREAFWKARKAVGDPIADVALPILHNKGINGSFANWLTGLRDNPKRLNQLGVDLMIEHAKAVTNDLDQCIGNVPGVLGPSQVAEYHHQVFTKHGIGSWLLGADGSWLFGGTLFNIPADLYRRTWCRACDFVSSRVGAN